MSKKTEIVEAIDEAVALALAFIQKDHPNTKEFVRITRGIETLIYSRAHLLQQFAPND